MWLSQSDIAAGVVKGVVILCGLMVWADGQNLNNCGEVLTATPLQNTLTSPGFPANYKDNVECVWTITADSPDKAVQVTTNTFSLERRIAGSCYDYLKVYDGPNTMSPEMQEFCGTDWLDVRSSGAHITLHFKTDGTEVAQGFSLTYKEVSGSNYSSQCGGTHTARSFGISFTSPGYPQTYENNIECVWTIMAFSADKVVQVTTHSSALEEKSGNQCYDYLKAFDGQDIFSTEIKELCGTDQMNVRSSGRYMTLQFKTDGSVVAQGFYLEYQEVTAQDTSSECGGTHTAERYADKTLTSPGYPAQYQNKLSCVWMIQAVSSTGTFVRVTVIESTIQEMVDGRCLDSMHAYDGIYGSSPEIRQWCGTETPTVESSGRYLSLRFYTDTSQTQTGFTLRYREVASMLPCGADQLAAIVSPQTLMSPGYPTGYTNGMECVWYVRAALTDQKIKVEVLHTDLETTVTRECTNDYVAVLDGLDTSREELQRFCDRETPSVISSGYGVTIVFHTDVSITGKGFKLDYSAGYFQPCEGREVDVSHDMYYIISPHWPNGYPDHLDCWWRFQAVGGYSVYVELMDGQMESGIGCSHDYLAAYDGSSRYSPELARWCGDRTGSAISTGTVMYVVFSSDGSFSGAGFKFGYQMRERPEVESNADTNVGSIVGGIIGGIVLLVVVVAIIACCCCSRKSRAPPPVVTPHSMQPQQVYYTNQGMISTPSAPGYLTPASAGGYPVAGGYPTTPMTFNPAAPPPAYGDVIKDGSAYQVVGPQPYPGAGVPQTGYTGTGVPSTAYPDTWVPPAAYPGTGISYQMSPAPGVSPPVYPSAGISEGQPNSDARFGPATSSSATQPSPAVSPEDGPDGGQLLPSAPTSGSDTTPSGFDNPAGPS